jgi:hypothetical protein
MGWQAPSDLATRRRGRSSADPLRRVSAKRPRYPVPWELLQPWTLVSWQTALPPRVEALMWSR